MAPLRFLMRPLLNFATLLRQPGLRSRLEQGKEDKFIADVLAAKTEAKLAECIPADPANAKLLAKYLKQIVVKVIHLTDFHPAKSKVEKPDIERVAGEFREFLEKAPGAGGTSQSIIGEIR